MDGDVEASAENVEVLPRVLTDEEKLLAVFEYLRRVGEIPESMLSGGYEALDVYLQGKLH